MLDNVLLLHERRRRAVPHGKNAANDGTRQENLALIVDRVVRRLGERVLLLQRGGIALALELEHGERESGARHDLKEVAPRLDQGGKLLAQADVLADVRLQALDAERPDDEPDLEAAEAPTKGDLPVAVVGHEPRVGVVVAQDGQGDAERLDQPAALPHPQHAAVKVGQQPLVQVGVEAVEPVQPRRQVLVLGAHEGHARVRRVHVHPDLAGLPRRRQLRQHVGDRVKVVRRARVRRAQRRRQVERLEPLGAQLLDRRPQALARHLVPVAGVHGHRAVPHARDHGRLLGRAVRRRAAKGHELAAPDGEGVLEVLAGQARLRRLPQVLIPRGHHDGRDGLGRGAVDHAAAVGRAGRQVALGQRKGLGEPVQHDGLELRHRGRADPVEGRAGEGG